MASGITNRAKFNANECLYKNVDPTGISTGFKLMLIRVASGTPSPDPDFALFSDWTTGLYEEIPAGNGYIAGGYTVERSVVGFDAHVENDTNDRAELQMKDVVVSAGAGGSIPTSGAGFTFALLTDDEAVVANREVYAWMDMGGAQVVAANGSTTIADAEIRATTGV